MLSGDEVTHIITEHIIRTMFAVTSSYPLSTVAYIGQVSILF